MNTRLTIDFKNPLYLKQLKIASAEKNQSIREIVTEALDAYFSNYLENRAIQKLAEKTFEEWDNPLDAAYDKM